MLSRDLNNLEIANERMNQFENDVKHWKDYDYIIINKNLDVCFRQIENIIKINKEEFSIASQIAQ